MVKRIIKFCVIFPLYIFNIWIKILSLFSSRFKEISYDYQISYLDSLIEDINHKSIEGKDIKLSFYTPNSLCLFRAKTFSNKEPETLSWIEEFGKDEAVLFDIGANVGLYSIYHNKLNNGKCFAFEPSFFNLKLLLKNINLNDCQDLTNVITNPLSNHTGLSNFKYGSSIEGGALSAFGVGYGYDGKRIENNLDLNVIGFSLDKMISNKLINIIPNIVKLDVDGIEHIIIEGGKETLTHPDCKSILVEVNDNFEEQANKVESLLSSYGFTLRDKLHGEMQNNSLNFGGTYNQIWVKNNYEML
jgi:FkbM family methyltransferase